jgi:uncharacterized protein
MALFYADSSMLVKYHIDEVGSAWGRQMLDASAAHSISTVSLSQIEVWSALNRRVREGYLTAAEYQRVIADFAGLCESRYHIIDVALLNPDGIRGLLERHPLRAYDAIQLAAALAVKNTLAAAHLEPLTFLAADDRLLAAAQAEGLAIDNPNHHP